MLWNKCCLTYVCCNLSKGLNWIHHHTQQSSPFLGLLSFSRSHNIITWPFREWNNNHFPPSHHQKHYLTHQIKDKVRYNLLVSPAYDFNPLIINHPLGPSESEEAPMALLFWNNKNSNDTGIDIDWHLISMDWMMLRA